MQRGGKISTNIRFNNEADGMNLVTYLFGGLLFVNNRKHRRKRTGDNNWWFNTSQLLQFQVPGVVPAVTLPRLTGILSIISDTCALLPMTSPKVCRGKGLLSLCFFSSAVGGTSVQRSAIFHVLITSAHPLPCPAPTMWWRNTWFMKCMKRSNWKSCQSSLWPVWLGHFSLMREMYK